MKLLIIEDNQRLAARLKNMLKDEFVVDIVTNGAHGEQLALYSPYDLILLDLGLPDKDGLSVCRSLRNLKITIPIIVMTADHTLKSRVELLDSGADDYVCKPFESEEMIARIHAVLRRNRQAHQDLKIRASDLEIDVMSREVRRGGIRIPLRRKEYEILEYLVSNKGRIITRDMILSRVWEADSDSWRNTVDVHVKYLRDKIDKPFKEHIIKTEYGIGYMIDDDQE